MWLVNRKPPTRRMSRPSRVPQDNRYIPTYGLKQPRRGRKKRRGRRRIKKREGEGEEDEEEEEYFKR
jgi:hypothetical protein